MRTRDLEHAHERLDGLGEVVVDVFRQGVERVAHHALPDKLERSAAHPHHYIDLSWTVDHTLLDCFAELYTLARVSYHDIEKTENDDDPVDDTIEGRHHVAHMVNRKDRVEKLALLPVMLVYARYTTQSVHGAQR